MTVGFVLLHVDSVVTLGEYRGVVVGVLDVDVDQHTAGEGRGALVYGLDLQH